MGKKILVVGGVAGGASAAARLRRLSEDAEIIMFEKGEHISFANCGLPYYIGGTIQERKNLFVQTPAAMKARFNIDVRIFNEVMDINSDAKAVKVKNNVTGEVYEESYDALVLSPGSIPFVPKIEGIDVENIFTIWNVADTDKIYKYMSDKLPKKAVIVGGGFIGVEMMENLHEVGLNVTLVEAVNQLLPPIDSDMASYVHSYIRKKGVEVLLSEKVVKFEKNNYTTNILFESGKKIEADMIIWCAGVRPNTDFLVKSGIELNKRGSIIVNDYLETNLPDVYAVGDAVEVVDFVAKVKTSIPLAGPANKQGRIVAGNIVGGDKKAKYNGTQGTSIVKIFDMVVASTGNSEKTLKANNADYLYSVTSGVSNSSYYPGGTDTNIKLIYNKDGKILGAQIVGYKGVDKRIDVLATTLRLGGNIFDLTELELAYAPPFSSAKDPVNMAGYVASNVLDGDVKMAYVEEVANFDPNKTILLDVREVMEINAYKIDGITHIPLNSLRDNLDKLPKDKEIIVICRVGLRAYIGARILQGNGFKNVKVLTGGMKHYAMVKDGLSI